MFNSKAGTHDDAQAFIDARPEIIYWYTVIPNTFFLVSEETAGTLSKMFQTFTQKQGRFIILDTATDRAGWLPEKAWKLMAEPSSLGGS